MIRQCFILKTGILFHKDMFKNVGLDPDTLYPYVKRRPPVVHSTPGSLAYNFFAKDYKRTVKPEEPFVNEEEEDMLDALTPIYDQLKMAKSWWVLEILPNKQVYQKEDDSWTQTRGYVKLVLLEDNTDLGFRLSYSMNFGKPRIIPKQAKLGVKVHRSVKVRMEADGFKDVNYKPAASFHVEPTWAD